MNLMVNACSYNNKYPHILQFLGKNEKINRYNLGKHSQQKSTQQMQAIEHKIEHSLEKPTAIHTQSLHI